MWIRSHTSFLLLSLFVGCFLNFPLSLSISFRRFLLFLAVVMLQGGKARAAEPEQQPRSSKSAKVTIPCTSIFLLPFSFSISFRRFPLFFVSHMECCTAGHGRRSSSSCSGTQLPEERQGHFPALRQPGLRVTHTLLVVGRGEQSDVPKDLPLSQRRQSPRRKSSGEC